MGSIEDILAQEDVNWKTAKAPKKVFKVKEGIYHAIVSDAKLSTSKSTGNPMLVIEITLHLASGKPWKMTTYSGLTGASLPYTKAKLEVMGVKLNSLKDLVPAVQNGDLVGIQLQVKVQDQANSDDMQNVYFQKRINADEVEPEEPVGFEDEMIPSEEYGEELPF